VIDRGYRIRAWNRKRETGTGVSPDAVSREIFGCWTASRRDLLKREFDRVFDTGELQQVEMESQASGEARYYRITKIPMRQDGHDISHVITIAKTSPSGARRNSASPKRRSSRPWGSSGGRHARDNNSARDDLACCEAWRSGPRSWSAGDRHGYASTSRSSTRGAALPPDRESLLDFSRPRAGQEPTDVNGVVERTLSCQAPRPLQATHGDA